MKKNFYSSMALTAICVVLGVIIGVQYNTVKKQKNIVELQRVTELTSTLKKVQDEKDLLDEQIIDLEKKISEYETSAANNDEGVQAIKNELDDVRMHGGFTNVSGRGILITLNDSRNANNNQGDANAYLVHAEDILSIINELNASGAEAISINGQRIIGSTSVRCVGPVVNINEVKVAAPFVFSAIGDSEVLESALLFPGGIVDSLSPWGIEITIKKQAEVTVPAYKEPIRMKEAVTVNGSE